MQIYSIYSIWHLGHTQNPDKFWSGCNTHKKNRLQIIVWYKDLTGFQHRQFLTFHISWGCPSNQTEISYVIKNDLKFKIQHFKFLVLIFFIA